MSEVRIVATGLGFPEGPVVMPDGSVILTEIRNNRCSRITPDGKVSLFSATGGGPNGLAVGPDGALYCCNNGGSRYVEGVSMGQGPHPDYKSGSIQRIDAHDRRGHDALHRMRRPQAQRAQRPGVRQGGRLVLHRSRQALRPPSRPWRPLLRAARWLEDRLPCLSHAEPERLRPLARRQGALRRRIPKGRVSGHSMSRGRACCASRRITPRTVAGIIAGAGRAGAFRQPGGDGQRQHRGGDARRPA